MRGKLMCAKSMLWSMHKMDVSRHLWRTAIYLAANYLCLGLMALIFVSPLIVGLIGHVILRTQKLIVLQWMVWQLRLQDSIFVFAYSADSKVNPWGVVMFGIVMYFWKEWREQYFAKC